VIDQGLLWSMAVMAVAVWLTLATAPPRTTNRRNLLDSAIGPALLGLLVGRVVAMLLEDPRSLAPPADILVLRGGVELWPAVSVGVIAGFVATRRDRRNGWAALADAAPSCLVGYAA
jgi:prolipoprotein diacylglyceryltransferase